MRRRCASSAATAHSAPDAHRPGLSAHGRLASVPRPAADYVCDAAHAPCVTTDRVFYSEGENVHVSFSGSVSYGAVLLRGVHGKARGTLHGRYTDGRPIPSATPGSKTKSGNVVFDVASYELPAGDYEVVLTDEKFVAMDTTSITHIVVHPPFGAAASLVLAFISRALYFSFWCPESARYTASLVTHNNVSTVQRTQNRAQSARRPTGGAPRTSR